MTNFYASVLNSNNEMPHNSAGTFAVLNNINYWNGDEGYANGLYMKYNEVDVLIESGERRKKKKRGTWITFFYEQNIQIEVNYDFNNPLKEKYIEIESGKPFSGTFTYTDQKANIKEIRNIKKGVRNGKTKFYDMSTDKLIRKEQYRDGVLQ